MQGKVCFCENCLRSFCPHVPYVHRHADPWREAWGSAGTPTPSHAFTEARPQTSPQIPPKANVQTLPKHPTNTPTGSRVEYPYTLLHAHIRPQRYPIDTLQSLSYTPQPHTHPTDTTQTLLLTPPKSSTSISKNTLQTLADTPPHVFHRFPLQHSATCIS